MAKKRKKEKAEKEEYEFRPPEFNEKEFLEKELRDTKTMIWTVLYAVLFGVGAGIMMLASEDLLGLAFMVGIAGIVSLKYFYPLIKVDIKSFQKKNWLGNIAVFFFTFLAIWVLVLNVPLSDHAKPTVEKVIVWVSDGTTVKGIEYKYIDTQGIYGWVPLNASDNLEEMIKSSAGLTVNITAKVADNGDLRSVVIEVTSGATVTSPMIGEGEFRFGYQMSSTELDPGADLSFTITATDDADNSVIWHPDRNVPVAS